MHQAAAAHKLAMRFMAKGRPSGISGPNLEPKSWSAHSVEAARLAHAAGKLMGAFSDTVLAVQRLAERGEADRPGDFTSKWPSVAGGNGNRRGYGQWGGARPGVPVGGMSEIASPTLQARLESSLGTCSGCTALPR